MDWQFRRFDTLDTTNLFALMKLRVDVFVVEQNCAYPELDEHDTGPDTLHLLGLSDKALAAYARAMPGLTPPPVVSDALAQLTTAPEDGRMVRIGRVVVAPAFRGKALGQRLMQRMISHLDQEYPEQVQFLGAQVPVRDLYESLGFIPVSGSYLEDGIPHIDMLRMPPSLSHQPRPA